jgi:hypothetical protein
VRALATALLHFKSYDATHEDVAQYLGSKFYLDYLRDLLEAREEKKAVR